MVRLLGPDLHFGLAEQRVARGQRDRPRLARQRADPDRAEPAVLAERERVVAHQRGRARQGQRDLAAAVPALVAVGVDGAEHRPGRVGAVGGDGRVVHRHGEGVAGRVGRHPQLGHLPAADEALDEQFGGGVRDVLGEVDQKGRVDQAAVQRRAEGGQRAGHVRAADEDLELLAVAGDHRGRPGTGAGTRRRPPRRTPG